MFATVKFKFTIVSLWAWMFQLIQKPLASSFSNLTHTVFNFGRIFKVTGSRELCSACTTLVDSKLGRPNEKESLWDPRLLSVLIFDLSWLEEFRTISLVSFSASFLLKIHGRLKFSDWLQRNASRSIIIRKAVSTGATDKFCKFDHD